MESYSSDMKETIDTTLLGPSRQTEQALTVVKDMFAKYLTENLYLEEITAPLFVQTGTGLDDTSNAVDKVLIQLKNISASVAIARSLAKWNRAKIKELKLPPGEGVLADVRTILPDQDIGPTAAFYVKKWEWEKRIWLGDKTLACLKEAVLTVYGCLKRTATVLNELLGPCDLAIPEDIIFIHAEELLRRYPTLTVAEREHMIVKDKHAVFIIGIGGILSNNEPHDLRVPDVDDWSTENEDGYYGLNGDMLVWHPSLGKALKLGSTGIRVDQVSMENQLKLGGYQADAKLRFHASVLDGQYPLTLGGDIDQSRLSMYLLQKDNIAEVQPAIWE